MATKNFTKAMDLAYGLIDGSQTAYKAARDGLGNTIVTNYAATLTISQTASTGVVTISLVSKDGTVIDTKTLDLDTEKIIVSASLDYQNKKLIFTLKDGSTIECDVSAIIDAPNKIEHVQAEGVELPINNRTVNVTKMSLGLNNVDNTRDLSKPISNPTQAELTRIENKLNAEIQNRESADTSEAQTRANADNTLTNNLNTEIQTRTNQVNAINSAIDKTVVSDATLTAVGDVVKTTYNKVNIKDGTTSTKDVTIPLATSSTAGAMPPSSVVAIQNLRTDVDALKGQNVRLLYTAGSAPTAAQIEAFVRSKGHTDPTKWAGISVVVKSTNHIWRYFENDGWIDIGLDTVSQFTNSVAGIILGSELDGQVYAEDNGTGSVVGWTSLKNRVAAVEVGKQDVLTFDNVPTASSNNVVKSGGVYDALPTIEEVGY